jgi:hypothetical protein
VAREGLESASQAAWFERVDREIDNLRFAVNWAVERSLCDVGCDLVAAAARPALFRLAAGRAILESAARLLEVVRRSDPDRVAIAAAAAAVSAALALVFDRAAEYVDEALAHATGPDDPAVFHAEAARGYVVVTARGDITGGIPYARSCVAWMRRNGTDFELSWVLGVLATWLSGGAAPEEAGTTAREALEVARRAGAPSLVFGSLVALAESSLEADPEAARAYLREAATVHASGSVVEDAAVAAMMTVGARVDEAGIVLQAGAELLRTEPAEPLILSIVVESLAKVVEPRFPEQAVMLHGAADTLTPGLAALRRVSRLRGETSTVAVLGPDLCDRLRDEGAQMSAREVFDFARAVIDEALSD